MSHESRHPGLIQEPGCSKAEREQRMTAHESRHPEQPRTPAEKNRERMNMTHESKHPKESQLQKEPELIKAHESRHLWDSR
jgi:hypothetical protein